MTETKCVAGALMARLPKDDVAKIEAARVNGATWPQLAAVLRSVGYDDIRPAGLSRHMRKACACELTQSVAPTLALDITPAKELAP